MFNSEENLNMVWGLLSEKQQLNIENKNFFNSIVTDIQKNIELFPSIMVANKYLIQMCNNKFLYKNLQSRINEIETMKKGVSVQTMDFSDKNDKQYEKLDTLIDKTMKQRELEIQEYTKNFKTTNDLEKPKKLKIGETIHKKKVTFNLPDSSHLLKGAVETKSPPYNPMASKKEEDPVTTNSTQQKIVPSSQENIREQNSTQVMKINITDGEIKKTIICNIDNEFKISFSTEKSHEPVNSTINNIEIIYNH